jgi:hypothetical protein
MEPVSVSLMANAVCVCCGKPAQCVWRLYDVFHLKAGKYDDELACYECATDEYDMNVIPIEGIPNPRIEHGRQV